MRNHLGSIVDPTDVSLKVVLPGVQERLSSLDQKLGHIERFLTNKLPLLDVMDD